MGPVNQILYDELQRSRHGARLDRPLSATEAAVFQQAVRRSRRINRPILFDLTPEQYGMMIAAANGRCQQTKMAFSDERVGNMRFRPFRLSLDRIDSAQGYTMRNCQLVCALYNLGKNAASVDLFHQFMMEYARAQGAVIPDGLVLHRGIQRWEY